MWALSFLPASFHREHQTGDASAGPGKERLSQSSLPSISSPSQTMTMSQVTMSQLSLSPATLSQQSQPLSPPSVPPSANVAAGVCARAIDAQVPVASAAVPSAARSGGGSKKSASVGGDGGGGAKGKGTTKEWNKQQATATKALKADYFDIYMVKMLELKKSAGATWSEPGVRQQAQVDMESYYFKEKTEPRLRELGVFRPRGEGTL